MLWLLVAVVTELNRLQRTLVLRAVWGSVFGLGGVFCVPERAWKSREMCAV